MTNDGKLTKSEIKNINLHVKRDTGAIRVAGTTELDSGETIEAMAGELPPPNGREHGWLAVALSVLIDALETVAAKVVSDAEDDEPAPQAK